MYFHCSLIYMLVAQINDAQQYSDLKLDGTGFNNRQSLLNCVVNIS